MKSNLARSAVSAAASMIVGAVGYGIRAANDNRYCRNGFLLALAAGASAAQAAAVDVTAIVTDIGAQMASITAIAAAVLLIFVGLKAFKWVRRALS